MNFFQVKRSSSSKRKGNIINPLMLPSIAHRTFSYLNISNLLACRKVNKLWRDEATRRLQGVVVVKLDDWHSIEQFNRVILTHVKIFPYSMFTAIVLGEQLCLADKSVQLALTKLSPLIKQVTVKAKIGPVEWRWLLFDQFPNITELKICGLAPFQPIISTPAPDVGESYRLNTTPGCFLIIATASPSSLQPTSSPQLSHRTPATTSSSQYRAKDLTNLTKLTFNLQNRKSEDIFVRRFLRDIFSVVPNLRSVEWIKEDLFANDFQKTMFDCLMMKIKPEGESKLETFICPSLVCSTKELQDISRRMFPLSELQIQISSDVPAQCLENFLETLGATLKILKLEFSPGSSLNLQLTAGNLIHLKEVALTEYRRSIGFVGNLPALKKLTLTRTNIKRALLSIGWAFDDNKEQTELSKSLEQLFVFNDYLSRDQGNCTREIVLKLAHCFPNLKAIRLEGLDDSSLRHLFKSFCNLEEVYAPGGTYSDEAFRSYTGKDFSMSSGGRSPNRYTLSAFDASHLKGLRTLELESIGLTDKFITQGVINWRSIRNLSIKYCRIGYPTLSRILMEMDLQRLSLQYCTIPTEGIIGAHNDPVEMMQDEEALNLTYDLIQKWRFDTFRLLFIHDE